jgi:ligand-binding sensor domain-containing protein
MCGALLSAMVANAQDPRFRVERITTSNGQPLNAVFSLMQDSYGYIWIGNVNGMERFDGYSFHSYPYDAFNPSGLSGYKVTCMTEDSAKFIWAGALSNGLN